MILFFTTSLRISTVVPCPACGPPFTIGIDPEDEAMESACNDCTSHSLERGTVDVGVGAEAYGSPVAEETVPVWLTLTALGLKEERRF